MCGFIKRSKNPDNFEDTLIEFEERYVSSLPVKTFKSFLDRIIKVRNEFQKTRANLDIKGIREKHKFNNEENAYLEQAFPFLFNIDMKEPLTEKEFFWIREIIRNIDNDLTIYIKSGMPRILPECLDDFKSKSIIEFELTLKGTIRGKKYCSINSLEFLNGMVSSRIKALDRILQFYLDDKKRKKSTTKTIIKLKKARGPSKAITDRDIRIISEYNRLNSTYNHKVAVKKLAKKNELSERTIENIIQGERLK